MCVQTPQIFMIRHVVARVLRKTSSPVKWKRPLNVLGVVVFLSDVRSTLAPLVAARTLMGRSDFMMLFTVCVAAHHVCIASALVCRACVVKYKSHGHARSDIHLLHGVVQNGLPLW